MVGIAADSGIIPSGLSALVFSGLSALRSGLILIAAGERFRSLTRPGPTIELRSGDSMKADGEKQRPPAWA